MQLCPRCNYEFRKGDKFCPMCGLNLYSQDSNNIRLNDDQNEFYYNLPGVNSITQKSKKEFAYSYNPDSKPIRQTAFKTLGLKNLLKNNNDYHHCNKKAILEIEEMIEKNEQIVYALTGNLFIENLTGESKSFGYVSSIGNNNFTVVQSNGYYRSGVICITDKRTIFVTNSDKFHSVREFSNREVIDVLLDKMYKSGRLKIQTSKGNFVFSIFKYENAQKFLQIIKTHKMNAVSEIDKTN